MAEVTSITGGKRSPCLYCGRAEHPTPLACPRILMVHIDPEHGSITGLTFVDDYFDDEPPEAA